METAGEMEKFLFSFSSIVFGEPHGGRPLFGERSSFTFLAYSVIHEFWAG
jgi:hypothetical protein